MTAALRALLREFFDYAGLFPPAGLGMADAVRNYAAYRASPDAWMLGRFVLPVARLDELESAAAGLHEDGQPPWRLAVLLGDDPAGWETIRSFNSRVAHAAVDTVECRAGDLNGVTRLSAGRPPGLTLYVELPGGADFSLISTLAALGVRAKIRAGGVTAEAFPSTEMLLDFMSSCAAKNIAWKATAGLHHAIGASYRLTYEPDTMSAPMFGFLDVAMAAALLYAGAGTDAARGALTERDASTFRFDDQGVAWRDIRLTTTQLEAARSRFLIAVGSCSFAEPVAELGALGLFGAARNA